MHESVPYPASVPCPECGVSVPRYAEDMHVCDEEQRARFKRFQLRLEVERFESELASWLRSPAGRFSTFYAVRQRRAA